MAAKLALVAVSSACVPTGTIIRCAWQRGNTTILRVLICPGSHRFYIRQQKSLTPRVTICLRH